MTANRKKRMFEKKLRAKERRAERDVTTSMRRSARRQELKEERDGERYNSWWARHKPVSTEDAQIKAKMTAKHEAAARKRGKMHKLRLHRLKRIIDSEEDLVV